MQHTRTIRRSGFVAAAILAVAALTPCVASATVINLLGSVDDVQASNGSPISVGDTFSGMFNANLAADGSFDRPDVTNFNLTAGPAIYADLDGSSFNQFRGRVSSDGSTLADFLVLTGFRSVQGLETSVALNLRDGMPSSFSFTGSGSNTSTFGAYRASGTFNVTVGAAQVDVAEPSSIALFGLGTLMLGLVAFRRKQVPSADRI